MKVSSLIIGVAKYATKFFWTAICFEAVGERETLVNPPSG